MTSSPDPSTVEAAAADPIDTDWLMALGVDELLAHAAARRDAATGRLVTFSPKVFIPLTKLCRDRCGYCTFAQPPARLDSPYLRAEEVLAIARAGQATGCHEALFTLGEKPELRYDAARRWLAEHGYDSTVHYLHDMCRLVLDETGLLPHANAGALDRSELAALRSVSPSQGMMIETLAEVEAHRSASDKDPRRRLDTLEVAGDLAIPFTSGILVGIGETRADRVEALVALAASHARHGHLQEVIVQNFLPKPGTAMAAAPAAAVADHLDAVALARMILPPEVAVQAPPNLSDDAARLLDAGISDWGGVSPVTGDHVNPERPWPHLDRLREVTETAGFTLQARLTAHPRFVRDPERWLDPAVRFAVLDRSDAEGYARPDDGGWYSGADATPPTLVTGPTTGPTTCPSSGPNSGPKPGASRDRGPVDELVDAALSGERLDEDAIVTLFGARGADVDTVVACADELRQRTVGDIVTWVHNRNVNYTNVCTFKCRFCGFSKGPLSLDLRGKPYLLTLDDIAERAAEAEALGATEICLQGGIHPDFDGDYYLAVTSAVHAAAPSLHIHGFTALEVSEGARRNGEPVEAYLTRLREAGLRTLPGTAAEILDDDVRAVLCPDKISTDEWLDVHRTAHRVGLRSNVTIMFGAVEHPRSWARHLVATRSLNDETGGFTEFVPLPFVHMASPIYLQRKARRGPTFREAVLMHAVGRIAYHGSIDNVQASWVKLGLDGARQMLRAGANDLGGTLMDENISRAAGASHGQAVGLAELHEMVDPIGRPLRQRTTLYGAVSPGDGCAAATEPAPGGDTSAAPGTRRRVPIPVIAQ